MPPPLVTPIRRTRPTVTSPRVRFYGPHPSPKGKTSLFIVYMGAYTTTSTISFSRAFANLLARIVSLNDFSPPLWLAIVHAIPSLDELLPLSWPDLLPILASNLPPDIYALFAFVASPTYRVHDPLPPRMVPISLLPTITGPTPSPTQS